MPGISRLAAIVLALPLAGCFSPALMAVSVPASVAMQPQRAGASPRTCAGDPHCTIARPP